MKGDFVMFNMFKFILSKCNVVTLEKVLTVSGIVITAVGGLVGMEADEYRRKEDIKRLKEEIKNDI